MGVNSPEIPVILFRKGQEAMVDGYRRFPHDAQVRLDQQVVHLVTAPSIEFSTGTIPKSSCPDSTSLKTSWKLGQGMGMRL